MTAPVFAFTPAPKRPVAPVAIAFLTPINNKAPARKTHRRVVTGAGGGLPRLVTTGYGGADEKQKAARFTHCTRQVADVEELFEALRLHSQQNCLAIRGQVRPDAGAVIYRRLAEEGADIWDTPSRLIVIDLDHEVAPAGLDVDDDQAVGEYLRGRLPAELRNVSCVVQFSNSYGLWRLETGRARTLKAHIWLLNDEPVDGVELRRWMTDQNRIGECGQLDPQVASANQPIYSANPIFQDCVDPVPQRLFLLLSDNNRDTASVRPPAAPARAVYAPGAVGSRCMNKLRPLVAAIQRTAESGLPRHPVINAVAFTAGRLVAGGAFTVEEALAALMPVALETGSDGAERAVRDGLLAGMNCGSPIMVGAPRIDGAAPSVDPGPELPTAQEAAAALDAKLVEFFDTVQGGGGAKVGIAGAAGLGKTTRALAIANERGLTVDHFVPTQKLAQEQVDRLPVGAAIAIRGRTHCDESRPALCAKAEAAEALQAAGIGNQAQVFLCGKYDFGAKQFPCPYSKGCGYHAQFNSPAPIRFYSHEWLTIVQKERPGFLAANVAIVDENFAGSFESKHRWTFESLAEAGGLFFDIGDAVRNGTLNQADHGAAIEAALKLQTGHSFPPIHPEMSAQEAVKTVKQWQSLPRAKTPPYDLLRAARDVLKSGESKRLYAETLNDKTTVYFDAIKPLAIDSKNWLFLDASLIPSVVNTVMPGTEVVEIQARLNATFIQIADSALSLARLNADNDHLMSRIAEFAERLKATNPNGAVIGPKDFMEKALAAGHFAGLVTSHFGALRGLNTMEDCEWLIMIGRNEPPVWAVERKARAWFAGDSTLEIGTARRAPGWIHGPDGAVETGAVTSFGDAHCQDILESLREQESLQSVNRLRLVHAVKPKTVYLLSNLPLPGIRPDVLTTLDALLLPGRLAEVMNRDKAILGGAMLAKRHPDLFENVKQAGNDLTTLQSLYPLYRILIGNLGIEGLITPVALVAQNYRTGSQKGGKPRRALLYETAAAAPLLTALHDGERVTLHARDEAEPAAPVAEPAVPDWHITTPPPSPADWLPVTGAYPAPADWLPPDRGVDLYASLERLSIMDCDDIAIPAGIAGLCNRFVDTQFAVHPTDLGAPLPDPPPLPEPAAHIGGRTGGCRGRVIVNYQPAEMRWSLWTILFPTTTGTIREPKPVTRAEAWRYASSLTGCIGVTPVGAPQ